MKLILKKTILISLTTFLLNGCSSDSSTNTPISPLNNTDILNNTIKDIRDNNISFGNSLSKIENSSFETITKSQNDTISDIWDISFKIDNNDINNFNIGIKMVVPSGSIGKIVYENISIENGVISSPNIIWIKGIKKNDDNTSTTQINSSEYLEELKAIIDVVVSLDNDIITLNFGTIAQNQTLISEDSFRKIGDYNITIVSDKLDILGVNKSNYGKMIDYELVNNNFINSDTLTGILKIKE
ncbi:MAG: hypothetical protein U9Q30_04105 [Campylobacterota bacterium]|nr:hypothetical protein [Campylobacterota bacterium]